MERPNARVARASSEIRRGSATRDRMETGRRVAIGGRDARPHRSSGARTRPARGVPAMTCALVAGWRDRSPTWGTFGRWRISESSQENRLTLRRRHSIDTGFDAGIQLGLACRWMSPSTPMDMVSNWTVARQSRHRSRCMRSWLARADALPVQARLAGRKEICRSALGAKDDCRQQAEGGSGKMRVPENRFCRDFSLTSHLTRVESWALLSRSSVTNPS